MLFLMFGQPAKGVPMLPLMLYACPRCGGIQDLWPGEYWTVTCNRCKITWSLQEFLQESENKLGTGECPLCVGTGEHTIDVRTLTLWKKQD